MATDAKTKAQGAKPEAKQEPAKPTIVKIVKQPEKAYRANSARGLYWERFQQFNGKPLGDLEESCQKDPPSQPKKGSLAGKTEPFGGWLSFFKQQGLVTTVQAK